MQTAPATRRLAKQIAQAVDLEGFFAANRDRIAPDTVAELKAEVDRLVKVDLARAEPLARATHRIAALLDDPVSLGYGDAAVAYVHQYSGRLAEAEPLYRAAIERLKKAGKHVEAAALERQFVGILTRQGRSKEALEVARRARRTLTRAGEKLLLAQLESNVGNIYFYVLHRHSTALKYFDRAQSLMEEIGDSASLAVVQYSRANVLVELDRPEEAIDNYERAERGHAGAGESHFAAHCRYLAAQGHSTLGRYGDALKRYYGARERFQEALDPDSAAWTALLLAELYLRLNVADEAGTFASLAIEEFRQLDDHDAEIGRALVVNARVAERRRDYALAASELAEAQTIFDRLSMETFRADVRLSRAELAVTQGDGASGVELAREAGQLYQRARLQGRRARARLTEAEGERLIGNTVRASQLARHALRGSVRAHDPLLEARAEGLIGALELDRGRHEAGVASLERAVAGVEKLRLHLRPGEARAAFLVDKLPTYELLVTTNLKRGDAQGLRSAFRYVEMAKARALADLLVQHIASGRSSSSGADVRLRTQIMRRLEELNWYSSKIDGHQEKGGQRNARLDAHLRSELARCERDLSSLFHRLEVEDVELASLFAAEPAGLDELSRSLDVDEAVVEFFATDDALSAFVVTSDGTTAYPSYAKLASVERHLTGLRYQLEKFGLGASYANAHQMALRRSVDNHLEALHSELFAPLASQLSGRRLVVVPHGLLHYVPFHALKDVAGRYVIQDHEVSYAPSATVYQLCGRRPAPGAHVADLLAVGLSDSLTPHISEELESIAAYFKTSVRLEGCGASKAAFLDHAPRSRFLHLATHGSFRQDNPMFSSVRLADGPLSFYDVFDLELDADLVTLSACNTGLNRLSPGDELSGLMRGFLYAGAPSLMVSLWAVNDRSTAELMRAFYRFLADGTSKRRALQLAQLEGLERYGHPYYWAPFILMGKA